MSLLGRATNRDGGYNAIRGFAFQFDATILEAFANPGSIIGVEGDQDIDIEDFYIQVKVRSGNFLLSRVAKAVRQLLAQFANDTSRRYRLYCHFPDQEAGTRLALDGEQLEKILCDSSTSYTDEVKKLFIDRFEIVFAPDFEAQFASVLEELRNRHSLRSANQAVAYHAILNQHLTSLVISTPSGSRNTSAAQLDEAARKADHAIFRGSYQRHLGREKYLTLLKSQMGPRKSANVVKRERLLIAEVNPDAHTQDLIDLPRAFRTADL